MHDYYLILVIILGVLAIADLMVGVIINVVTKVMIFQSELLITQICITNLTLLDTVEEKLLISI